MNKIIFSFPGCETQGRVLASYTSSEEGSFILHRFPDGESLVTILSDVKDKEVIVLCSLNQPDEKFLPLSFFAETARTLGAKKITLVAPYLAYMRQDKSFNRGEAVTALSFAKLISLCADRLITIDPHLHRFKKLDEIYPIHTQTLHAADAIASWITRTIQHPLIIGPDGESSQWVRSVAEEIKAPFEVLEKTRINDVKVKVSFPHVSKYRNHVPVLVDDIISTGHTMCEAVKHLTDTGCLPPVCIGIHALFSGNAFTDLKLAGAGRIVTCNTISHPTNEIDIVPVLAKAIMMESA